MKTEFTEQEKAFFERHKDRTSKINNIAIAIVFLLFLGILLDAFNGFHILRKAKSFHWGIGGLFLLGAFYFIGEAGSEWIHSKDDVTHPLLKRVFHLCILLFFAGILMVIAYFTFTYLGYY